VHAPGELTDLLRRAQQGDSEAADAVFAATYPELRRLARARLRGGGRQTLLDTTSLVHESYLRFVANKRLRLEDRVHFMCYAGRVMRSVIVDFARRRGALRRGRGTTRVSLTLEIDGAARGEAEILRVNEALDALSALDPRMARVVEMRYFGGMNETEIAEALAVTDRTVRRDWEKARLWLAEWLRPA
jgi:RNA polymerase sigma factor (TIGR02999 family)